MFDIINTLIANGQIAWSGQIDPVIRAILQEADRRGWRRDRRDSSFAVLAIRDHERLTCYRATHTWRVYRRP